jgi:hypothetical protein
MLQIAGLVSVLGIVAAVSVPVCQRESYGSHFREPTEGLRRIGKEAKVYYNEHNGQLPESVQLTPGPPPRGILRIDPKEAWSQPTWAALKFRPSPEGVPHSYSFAFEKTKTGFSATARGDLDGDGIYSLFELRGTIMNTGELDIDEDVYVESEFE